MDYLFLTTGFSSYLGLLIFLLWFRIMFRSQALRYNLPKRYGLILVVLFLIPFQQRFYKVLRPLSIKLIDPKWEIPDYFEIHLDWFLSDFILLPLFFLFLKKTRGEWYELLWKRERKLLTLFLFFSLFSIVTSDFSSYFLSYWRWAHILLPATLYYLLAHLNFSNGLIVKKIAQIVLFVSLIECCIAIPQYFVQHSLGLKSLGEPTLIASNFLGPSFPMKEGSLWIFDSFFGVIRGKESVIRASGTVPHPNVLGGVMVFGLLMTYYLYGLGRKRGYLSVSILIQLFSLFITYSRSALYAWLIASFFWIFLTSIKEKKIHSLFWVVLGSFLVCLGCFYPQIFERGGVISYNTVAKNSDELRLTLHRVAFSMIKSHPYLGLGFNNYFLFFKTYAENFSIPPTYIHNIYLYLVTEVGFLGAIPFFCFCFSLLKKGWRSRNDSATLVFLIIFFTMLCIGMVDYYMLSTQEARLIFFLTAGLLSFSASQAEKGLMKV